MFDVPLKMDLFEQRGNFQKALGEWYATAQRPLPWRTQASLYRTVVSELMAQQTQIKTMLPYFERWMLRFPDFPSLAESPEAEVLKHWEGLGYYSRARNLHKLAKAYVAADPKPQTREEWQTLPGIGPYTSAAIASIAFHEPVAVVDGNVVRILARLSHDTRSFKSNGEAVKAFTSLAEEMVNPQQPGDHNQAMMELGATICLKRKPLCTLCPVQSFCSSYAHHDVESIPRIQRKATEKVEIDRLWIVNEEAILLHKIPTTAGQLAGQYELPKAQQLGCANFDSKPLATKSRSITHRRIKERIYAVNLTKALKKHLAANPELYWIPFERLDTVTLSGPHRRWVEELRTSSNAYT